MVFHINWANGLIRFGRCGHNHDNSQTDAADNFSEDNPLGDPWTSARRSKSKGQSMQLCVPIDKPKPVFFAAKLNRFLLRSGRFVPSLATGLCGVFCRKPARWGARHRHRESLGEKPTAIRTVFEHRSWFVIGSVSPCWNGICPFAYLKPLPYFSLKIGNTGNFPASFWGLIFRPSQHAVEHQNTEATISPAFNH